MHPVRDVQLQVHYTQLPFDPAKVAVSLFAAEILYRSLAEDYSNEAMYDFVKDALQVLDHETRVAAFPVWFVLEFCRHCGLYPEQGDGYFEPLTGGYTPHSSATSFGEEESHALAELIDASYVSARDWSAPPAVRRQVLRRLTDYLRRHLGNDQPIRSLDVLEDVFR